MTAHEQTQASCTGGSRNEYSSADRLGSLQARSVVKKAGGT
jgi:hypothetical protein